MNTPRILIVEDETIIAYALRLRLERNKYIIGPLTMSGEEAINNVNTFKPDIILMDIKLKGDIDGIETARLISNEKDIPIVYITGNTNLLNTDRFRMAKPAGVLMKPISYTKMFALLREVLQSRKKNHQSTPIPCKQLWGRQRHGGNRGKG